MSDAMLGRHINVRLVGDRAVRRDGDRHPASGLQDVVEADALGERAAGDARRDPRLREVRGVERARTADKVLGVGRPSRECRDVDRGGDGGDAAADNLLHVHHYFPATRAGGKPPRDRLPSLVGHPEVYRQCLEINGNNVNYPVESSV